MFSVGGPQGASHQNGKFPFTGAIKVNHEPPASGQLVLSTVSLVRKNFPRSYEACSSTKMRNFSC